MLSTLVVDLQARVVTKSHQGKKKVTWNNNKYGKHM